MDADERLSAVEAILRAIGSLDPLAEAVTVLASYVDGGAAIFDHDGNAVRSVGRAPVRLLSHEIKGGFDDGEREIGRWRALLRPATIRGSRYAVALVSSDAAFIAGDGSWLLDQMAAILRSLDGVVAFAAYERVRRSEQVLRQLEAGVSTARVPYCWEQLEGLNFEPYAPVVYVRGTCAGAAAALVERVENASGQKGAGAALIHQPTGVDGVSAFRLLVSAEFDVESFFSDAPGVTSAGVSAPFTDLYLLPDHAAAAVRAERMAEVKGSQLQRVEDLRPLEWLLAQRSSRLDQAQFDRFADVLEGSPGLVATVRAFIRNSQNIDACAAELSLHPNSVRYRLAQVEAKYGESLKDVDFLASLSIAFVWR